MLLLPEFRHNILEVNRSIVLVGALDEGAEPITAESVKDTLTTCEHTRLKQFKHLPSAWGYAAGRIVLRELVSQLFDISPKSTVLRLEETGKPRIEYPSGVAASISHSGTYVAIVLSRGGECGIDIEPIADLPDSLPIHKNFFSQNQRAWIAEAGSESERARRFLRLWTRKEAYLKATGEGLSGLSQGIEFEGKVRSGVKVRDQSRLGAMNNGFWVFDIADHPEYCLSVCFDSNCQKIEVFPLRIGALHPFCVNEL